MIGKIVQGKSFRGLLNYLHSKQDAQCIGGNMAGETPRELAAEFRVARELNLRLKKAVCHVSLSLPKHEQLDDEQWLAIARDYVMGMGYQDCQYVVYRHHDQDHDHVHLAICRIQMTDGKTVSDSWEKRRAEILIRSLEKLYQLESVQPSWEKLEAAPTTGEMRQFERTGELPIRVRLQAQIDHVVARSSSIAQLIEQLKMQGVGIRLRVVHKERITGISYNLDGIAFSGSKLGRAYTFPGLQKHKGLHYDDATEYERTCQAAEQSQSAPGVDAAIVAEFEQIAERFGGAIAHSRNRVDRNEAISELPTAASSRANQLPTNVESTEPESAADQYASHSDQSTSVSSDANRHEPARAANSSESGTRIIEERNDRSGTESSRYSPIVSRLQPIISHPSRATNESGESNWTTISDPYTAERESAANDFEQNGVSSEAISEWGSGDVSRNLRDVDLFGNARCRDRMDSASTSTPHQSEPRSSTGQQQRDSARTARTGTAANSGQDGNSTAEEIKLNEDQQRWQRYSLGVQASNTVKLNALVARRAFEDGQAPQAIAQMLRYSPFVKEMIDKQSSTEKIQAYIRQTVHDACQKEQQQQRKRQKQRSINLEI